MAKIAMVRVHGRVRMDKKMADTLCMLHLYNKNHATVVDDTPQNKGMIHKVRDQITFGNISNSFFNELMEKKGIVYDGPESDPKGKISYARRYIEANGKKYEKFIPLHPPRKGYGRKGIKKPFNRSGALGDRKKEIEELLKRMM